MTKSLISQRQEPSEKRGRGLLGPGQSKAGHRTGGKQVTTGRGTSVGEGKGVWAIVILVELARPASRWISGTLGCLLSLGLRITE